MDISFKKNPNIFLGDKFMTNVFWGEKPAESEYRGRQAEFRLLGAQIQDGVQSSLK